MGVDRERVGVWGGSPRPFPPGRRQPVTTAMIEDVSRLPDRRPRGCEGAGGNARRRPAAPRPISSLPQGCKSRAIDRYDSTISGCGPSDRAVIPDGAQRYAVTVSPTWREPCVPPVANNPGGAASRARCAGGAGAQGGDKIAILRGRAYTFYIHGGQVTSLESGLPSPAWLPGCQRATLPAPPALPSAVAFPVLRLCPRSLPDARAFHS